MKRLLKLLKAKYYFVRFIITTDPLNQTLTGVGNYTKNLINYSGKYLPQKDIYFYNAGLISKKPKNFFSKSRLLMKVKRKATKFFSFDDRKFKGDDIFHGTNGFIPQDSPKSVVTIHDLSIFRYPETHPVERLRFFEDNFFSTLSRSDHIITVSQSIKNELIEDFSVSEKKITPIYLGSKLLDSPPINPVNKQRILKKHSLIDKEYFLYIGTLEPRKNLKRLLNAYLNLPEIVKRNYPLVLIGDGGWKSEEVKLLIKNNQEFIKYFGYLSEKDIKVFYKSARIFLYPSIYEGFGLPICEAISCSTDVAISDIKVFKELYPSAYFFNPYDEKSIAETIMEILEKEDNKFKEKEIKTMYSWNKCAMQTFSVYRSLAQ